MADESRARTLLILASQRGLVPSDVRASDSQARTLLLHGVDRKTVVELAQEESRRTLRTCPVCRGPMRDLACADCGVKLSVDLDAPADAGLGADVPEAVREAARDPKKHVGGYLLVQAVGEGGFGTVYRAWQKKLGRFVALKLMHPAEEKDAAQRFLREAHLAARLNHPNIVPVHEVGESDGRAFLVMELIDGRSLDGLRLEPRRTVDLLRQVALAIQSAHEAGIVHRDLKPHNVMLGHDGRVWVMDFGLARPLQREASSLTMSGTILGTPAYMAPEQAVGLACDARSDVYSLGATLYQMLSGAPPFEASNPVEILRQVTTEDPRPLRKINPRTPAEIETIVQKAMEKNPARRYATARELADDLGRWLAGETISARPAGPVVRALKWMRRHPTASSVAAVVLLAALAGAGILGYSMMKRRAHVRDVRERALAAERDGRLAEARDAYIELREEDPDDGLAHEKVFRLDAEIRASANRDRAGEFLHRAQDARNEYEQCQLGLGVLRTTHGALLAWIQPSDDETRKRDLWDLERRIEKLEFEAASATAHLLVSLSAAAGVDPGNCGANRELAGAYYRRFLDASESGRETDAMVNAELARHFDDGTYAPMLVPEGTLTIESVPPGAAITIQRYEEGPDRRLVPGKPFLYAGPGMKLASGSYLCVLGKAGYRPVRYPLLVGFGSSHRAAVRLYTDEEIGTEFVYVPGGPFLADKTSDFFLGRCEVTLGEYAEFLDALVAAGREAEAESRLPRTETGPMFRIAGGRVDLAGSDLRFPIVCVSHDDAVAYCEWRKVRLPTRLEWEKAARGVDGRIFPWGNRFDWTFTNGARSRKDANNILPVGSFGKDESPYGALDLAGNAQEWCADWAEEKLQMRAIAGGSAQFADASVFRSAWKGGTRPDVVSRGVGFRVARDPK